MIFQKCFGALGIATLVSVLGCASTPQKVTETDSGRKSYTEEAEGRAVTNAAARQAEAQTFVEIEYKPGSAILTESAKSSLRSIIEEARQDGKIDQVIVLSWSDYEYPSKSLKKLSKPQMDLADKRNKTIEKYVKEIRSVDVESYNMAEQPTAFSKWFNTTDSKLKNSLVAAGLPTTADSLQYPSKASHSVILVKVK